MNLKTNGFSYRFSDEKVRWWQSISAQQKLEWLEEANTFLRLVLNDEKQQIVKAFREGANSRTTVPGTDS